MSLVLSKATAEPFVQVCLLLLMTYIGKENGFDANFIFYKVGGPIAQDALAGVTDVAINTLVSVTPYFRSGKLRPLATTGEKRPPVLPDGCMVSVLAVAELDAKVR